MDEASVTDTTCTASIKVDDGSCRPIIKEDDVSHSNSITNKDVCEPSRPIIKEDDVSHSKAITNKDGSEPSRSIIKEDVKLPECFQGRLAFVLHNVFTPEECQDWIMKSEDMEGYIRATIDVGSGRLEERTEIRNSGRFLWENEDEADRIWQRVQEYVPCVWENHPRVGLSPRLRFLRYDPGEYFRPHQDGCYVAENKDRSYLTLQVYLSEGFKGGGTTFISWDNNERAEVVPKIGTVLVFDHDILHEGSEVIEGRKYVIRTDVMYTDSCLPQKRRLSDDQKRDVKIRR